MCVCPLSDLPLEKLLTQLRASILANINSLSSSSPELLKFQSALAIQCFTNEYIYKQTNDEKIKVKVLEKIIQNGLKNNEQPKPQAVLAMASYQALNHYDWHNSLAVTNDIQEVFSRQVEEPNHEEKLKKQIPILEEITDSISSSKEHNMRKVRILDGSV